LQKVKYYKCPHCGEKYKSLQTWGNHITLKHPNMIPEGYSYSRYFYYILTGKKNGNCIVCKNPTKWNETTQKYERFCDNPKCKENYRKQFKDRMIGKYGKVSLLDDPEQQRKMLANRKISGKYKFEDGTVVQYTGSYELDFVKMLDIFLHLNGSDIMMPSPHTYKYMYENNEHFYIPDAYIPSLNLEIEIKQSTSTHQSYTNRDKYKEYAKDEVLNSIKGINYFKIQDQNYAKFYDYINDLAITFDNNEIDSSALESSLDIRPKKEIKNKKPRLKLKDFQSSILDITNKDKYKDINTIEFTPMMNGEIILDENKIVGFYVTNKNGNIVWLDYISIFDKYKECGLGDQLLERAIRKYKVTNIKIDISNEVAINMYLNHGFREYTRDLKYLYLCRSLDF